MFSSNLASTYLFWNWKSGSVLSSASVTSPSRSSGLRSAYASRQACLSNGSPEWSEAWCLLSLPWPCSFATWWLARPSWTLTRWLTSSATSFIVSVISPNSSTWSATPLEKRTAASFTATLLSGNAWFCVLTRYQIQQSLDSLIGDLVFVRVLGWLHSPSWMKYFLGWYQSISWTPTPGLCSWSCGTYP